MVENGDQWWYISSSLAVITNLLKTQWRRNVLSALPAQACHAILPMRRPLKPWKYGRFPHEEFGWRFILCRSIHVSYTRNNLSICRGRHRERRVGAEAFDGTDRDDLAPVGIWRRQAQDRQLCQYSRPGRWARPRHIRRWGRLQSRHRADDGEGRYGRHRLYHHESQHHHMRRG